MDDKEFVKICNEELTASRAAAKLGLHHNTFKRRAEKLGCYRPNQGGRGLNKSRNVGKLPLEEIFKGKHPSYQTFKLKNRMLREGIKDNICEVCGLKEWNNSQIQMELHHLNGVRTDHRPNNLQMICPNCHSQTKTYRAKNIK
jgi:hypothetical protein